MKVLMDWYGTTFSCVRWGDCLSHSVCVRSGIRQGYNNNNDTRFVERRGAIASEALADRSSQLARNRREKMSFKSSFKYCQRVTVQNRCWQRVLNKQQLKIC